MTSFTLADWTELIASGGRQADVYTFQALGRKIFTNGHWMLLDCPIQAGDVIDKSSLALGEKAERYCDTSGSAPVRPERWACDQGFVQMSNGSMVHILYFHLIEDLYQHAGEWRGKGTEEPLQYIVGESLKAVVMPMAFPQEAA